MTKEQIIEKASRKLAYVHNAIDLYGDRPDLHDPEYWREYLTNDEWEDSDIGWESEQDEWCTDCSEYDSEQHCCPRYNRVIQEVVEEIMEERIYCKDCRFRDPEDKKCDNGAQWCAFPKKDDDFCSYGERKEKHDQSGSN